MGSGQIPHYQRRALLFRPERQLRGLASGNVMSLILLVLLIVGETSNQVYSAASLARLNAASEVYIQQSRGRVMPGASILTKPPPESTTAVSPNAPPTAPVTCNAQNASSQACYTATQQSRPAGR